MFHLNTLCKIAVYYYYSIRRVIKDTISWLIFVPTCRWREECDYEGVKLYNIVHDANSGKADYQHIIHALQLIQYSDKRRYRRVKKYIKCIVVLKLKSNAQYQRIGKICWIDMSKYNMSFKNEASRLAGTIIHESTHGVLESKYIPCTRGARLRIETLCVKESERFIKWIDKNKLDGKQ